MIKKIENTNKEVINLKKIIKGAFISIISTMFFLVIFSIILTYSNIQEKIIPVVTIIITVVSILIGGILSSIKINKNGMLTGMLVGSIYITLIYLSSSILTKNFNLSLYSIIMIILSIIAGGIGGIIGVNFKK